MKNFVTLFTVVVFLTACAGRDPHPVQVSQKGDGQLTCKELKYELGNIRGELEKILPSAENNSGQNVALGVAGVFLLVPFFFMDLSNAEQIEVVAYRQRYNHLAMFVNEKKCGFDVQPIPEFENEVMDKEKELNKNQYPSNKK